MYSGIMDIKGAAKDVIQTLYSEYGYYMTLINIPLTLASTAPTSMIPGGFRALCHARYRGCQ